MGYNISTKQSFKTFDNIQRFPGTADKLAFDITLSHSNGFRLIYNTNATMAIGLLYS